ncbi:hypothetical protein BSL78_15603 [Apostichopus japonicus]|uniref:ZU5 domain-containing protein n=1 Tax=Stichopus japonicus TaxID=307972 RepID=A0A2G8KHS6_STIJA|nr:hypothetical protein BSL78_15603 [Apostichopus japonicus]
MTPLIKLEPEGLALNKPAQLNYSSLGYYPEPDRHDVIIFTGLKDEENLQEVCFCKDSDEEYKLMLEDHQSKLSLGNYTTFQVTRTLNDGIDYASYIDLMMSSPDDSYHLMKEESTKHVDIDHLCAASRVSHQFRLKRNNDGDTDMVDVKLKVSQHEKNQTALILQSKVQINTPYMIGENILLSPQSQEILFRDLHPDLHKYEKLKGDIAKLLDEQHCKQLGMFFGITPAENETIQGAAESGKMLMKILDERELIMPDRMIGLYEGLKAIHYNKLARLVLEYIDTSQEKDGKENEGEKNDKKMVIVPVKPVVISKREPQLSVNFKILIEEGYKKLDVQRALKLSHGKLDLGRRLLLLAKEEHESLTLHKPVTLIIPHCAFTTTNQMGIDVYSGVLQTDNSVKWSLERTHLSCSMNSQHFAVKSQQPCLIGLHVPFIPKMRKRVCILPIVKRVSDSGDQFTIHLWFHNDDTLEHENLINEEIYQQKGTIIHDPVFVQLKSMTSTLHVSTNSSTSQCNPHPRKVNAANSCSMGNLHLLEEKLYAFNEWGQMVPAAVVYIVDFILD